MEVASGEYGVDLVKSAQTMTQFKPEPVDSGSWESHIPTIPALPSPLGTSCLPTLCVTESSFKDK